MAPRARQAKSKARIQKYEELESEDTAARRCSQHEIIIPPPPRLGNDVVIAKGLKKALSATRLLFDDLTFSLPRGGIVGVIGPNGAGKTTLFRMIVGEEKPDGGDAEGRRDGVSSAYVDQGRALDADQDGVAGDLGRAWTQIMVGKREINSRAYLSSVQLPRHRPAEEGRRPVGRRAQPAAPGEDC